MTFLKIFSLIASGIILVAGLYYYSTSSRKDVGFQRYFQPHFLNNTRNINLAFNSYYIAGINDNVVYLGNYTVLTHVIKSSISLRDTQLLALSILYDDKDSWNAAQVMVDSPTLYLIGYNPLFISHTILPDLLCSKRYDFKEYGFGLCMPISPSSVVLQRFEPKLHRNILTKVNLISSSKEDRPSILKPQIDGRFSTDGMLLKSSTLHSLVYVYYYRNEAIIMDTNLNVLSSLKTVDTNSIAKLTLDTNRATKTVTTIETPLVINKQACIYGDKLFILSARKADNEKQSLFDKASVVDIYDLTKGLYIFSFYLPDFKGHKVRDFKINAREVVALYDRWLVAYHMNFKKG